MGIYEILRRSAEKKDASEYIAVLDEDYEFYRHQTGTTMNKAQMSDMLRAFMSNENVVVHNQRCLFENDEVLVEHSVMDFADGTREAVLGFNKLKDGLIFQTESGATLIDKDS